LAGVNVFQAKTGDIGVKKETDFVDLHVKHKPGKRDNKSRKADNLIREISQQKQYNKQ